MSEHDQMEEFFRDRAENYEYSFNERDWEALEARLDRELPTRGGNFWGQVLAGILIISLPWWPWTQEQPTPLVNSNPISTTVDSKPEAVAVPNREEVNSEPSSISVSSSDANPSLVTESSTPSANTAPLSNTSAYLVVSAVDNPSRRAINALNQERLGLAFTPVNPATFSVSRPYRGSVKERTNTAMNEGKLDALKRGSAEDEIIEEPTVRDWQVYRPYLTVGGEYAGTQMDNSPQLGYRMGVGLQLQPLKHWSLSVGLNYANIGYTAYEREFYPDQEVYGSLVNAQYEHISWASGTCIMWEVPVAVRYHPTSWLSIGSGLRSYIIDSEHYDVYVMSQYSPVASKSTVAHDNNSSAFMAHWMISAGFQIPLGADYLEVQPFYQFPLQEIGTGNVKWHSAGVSLRYLF